MTGNCREHVLRLWEEKGKFALSFPLLLSKMDLEELENGNEPKLPEFKLGMNVKPSLTNYSHSSPFERYVNRQAGKILEQRQAGARQ